MKKPEQGFTLIVGGCHTYLLACAHEQQKFSVAADGYYLGLGIP
jgi:hypothetical protein